MQDVIEFERTISSWDPAHAQDQRAPAADVLELAERLLQPGAPPVPAPVWHAYLDRSRAAPFLAGLSDRPRRERWAETAFEIIRRSDYTLETLIDQRVQKHPNRVFLREARTPVAWTYDQARRRIQSIAAVLHACGTERPPRVALLTENSVDGACTDLACLAYDLFVAPLDVQLDAETLTWIFNRLAIDVVVSGDAQRAARLEQVRARVRKPFRIVHLQPEASQIGAEDLVLAQAISAMGSDDIARHLGARRRRRLDEPATVLFTSGSTGRPKGVVFTSYHLLAKRFARGAALPQVGDDEVLLCYLPLFHTFGRYLELMGTLYWGGTYVFAGNPSAENLLDLLGQVRPTALVSIPLRWVQIRDRCLEGLNPAAGRDKRLQHVRTIVGDRLRWGLSAAGHLEPRVFRFFNDNGVALCSGFGMTEATGGIMMTPPGQYVDGTVGIPLPGMQVRLTDIGELHIAGPYVASYLEKDDSDSEPEIEDGAELDLVEDRPSTAWLPTGDLFCVHDNGYYEIFDRVKDIYKNSKGKTIAPRRVESLFSDVPGIRRTFLVGDRREYNALLIVLEPSDPVLQAFSSPESLREYLRQIVVTANRLLAPYERIVSLAVLGRDFELERGELTPKGSYRRQVIETHFSTEIRELYRSRLKEVLCHGVRVQIPRWLYRDQGWLESDVHGNEAGLWVEGDGRRLTIQRAPSGRIRVGDLEYTLGGDVVDLALFSRQPLLWAGNPQLARFCPCKDGWDGSLGDASPQVILPCFAEPPVLHDEDTSWIGDYRLGEVHELASRSLFGRAEVALSALVELVAVLPRAYDHLASLIRRRLETLARHPDLQVRCLSYRTLLLDAPTPETSEMMPSFIDSGLPFLDEESIDVISRSHLERQRLEALRQRLYRYRTELPWPASGPVRAQFVDVFSLLSNFVRYHPEYFPEASLELNAWILHESDPELAASARQQLTTLTRWWEDHLLAGGHDAEAWRPKILYHEALADSDVARLDQVLRQTPFLGRSITMAFEDAAPEASQIPDEGVWVTRLPSIHRRPVFRVSVSTCARQHYDLLVMLADDLAHDKVLETSRWIMAISAYPFGPPVVPRFGWYDPELRALSIAYIQDLTGLERIREFASLRVPGVALPGVAEWRKLFIRAMAAFVAGWQASGRRIVPGLATPSNVAVLEPDFREGALILSLDDWRRYDSPLSLVRPLVYNFYRQTTRHHPWCQHYLDPIWIFEACMEALGEERTRAFLAELRTELETSPVRVLDELLLDALGQFAADLDRTYHYPLSLRSAIERYREWVQVAPQATSSAREQVVEELRFLYSLDRCPEIARYHLYRETYFADCSQDVAAAFDQLLGQMFGHPEQRAIQMVELSELQAALLDPEDRAVFVRMAFPHGSPEQRLEVLALGTVTKQVVIRSELHDIDGGTYTVREAIDASEVGRLYRRYVQAGFPKGIAANNSFYVMLDARDEIIGGVIYALESPTVANLRGIVVRSELKGRGLNSALLEDFCRRMENQGVEVVRTFFFARRFYARHGFRVDERWGGLVRILGASSGESSGFAVGPSDEPGPSLGEARPLP